MNYPTRLFVTPPKHNTRWCLFTMLMLFVTPAIRAQNCETGGPGQYRGQPVNFSFNASAGSTAPTTVITGQKTVYIDWIGSWSATSRDIIPALINGLGPSPLGAVIANYCDGMSVNSNPVGTSIALSTLPVAQLNTIPDGSTYDDAKIVNEVLFNDTQTRGWPEDPNAIYVFMLGFDVNQIVPGCGFHVASTGFRDKFGQYPFHMNVIVIGGTCVPDGVYFTNPPNGDGLADKSANGLLHELAEAITDPEGQGWHEKDNSGVEIADQCLNGWFGQYTTPTGTTANEYIGGRYFFLQPLWLNYPGRPGATVTGPHCAQGSGQSQVALPIFRPSNNQWYINLPNGRPYVQVGGTSGKPLTGDFDGDGVLDVANWDTASGWWTILLSSRNWDPNNPFRMQWGVAGDTPIVGDFDGDGTSDLVVIRQQGTLLYWYIAGSRNSFQPYKVVQWGVPGDTPIVGDFDGDHYSDPAVVRQQGSLLYWYIAGSRNSYQPYAVAQWGVPGDTPVAGDFDGDGMSDLTVVRQQGSQLYWYVAGSANSYQAYQVVQWGQAGDIPVAMDYDLDNRLDYAFWRPSNGTWYIAPSNDTPAGYTTQWGAAGDIPVPGSLFPIF